MKIKRADNFRAFSKEFIRKRIRTNSKENSDELEQGFGQIRTIRKISNEDSNNFEREFGKIRIRFCKISNKISDKISQ